MPFNPFKRDHIFVKFLDPSGCTVRGGIPFAYNLPGRSERWAVTEHPDPCDVDGKDCGAGRLHLMRGLDARYAPNAWHPWFAVVPSTATQIGASAEKISVDAVCLRRISVPMWWWMLRRGWGTEANLTRAYLTGAYLREADLRGADLTRAYLREADLRGADLTRAYLTGAIGYVALNK